MKVNEKDIIPAKLAFVNAKLKLCRLSRPLASIRASSEQALKHREQHVMSLRNRQQDLELELEQVRSELRALADMRVTFDPSLL